MTAVSQTAPTKYTLATRIFHWVGALLIVGAWVAIEQGDEFISLHKSIGVSFLIWTMLRIINRFVSKAPPHPPMPKWQVGVAHLTHLGLYLSMLAMPITGILMSMYNGYGVGVFGLFEIAPLVSPDRATARLLGNMHEDVVFVALVALVVAHVGGALYHQFIMKDNLIARMK